jgi:hypothetical protein
MRLASQSLFAYRLRSVLTVLGIVIGIAAVVLLTAIGKGIHQAALRRARESRTRHCRNQAVPNYQRCFSAHQKGDLRWGGGDCLCLAQSPRLYPPPVAYVAMGDGVEHMHVRFQDERQAHGRV